MKAFIITFCAVLLVACSTAQLLGSAMAVGCTTSADCMFGECCVSHTRPRGKRQDLPGSCHAMGQASESCFVSHSHYADDQIYYVNCPCEMGLTCKPNGSIDMPLGPMGNCEV